MNKEKRLVRMMQPTKDVAGAEMILPNTSGDHVKGIKRQAPIGNADLANKAYVDAQVAACLLNTGDTATGNYAFDTNVLFVDATNDRVGIGTTSPSQLLQVGTALYVDNVNKRIGVGMDNPTVSIDTPGSIRAQSCIYSNVWVNSAQNAWIIQRSGTNTLLGNSATGLMVIQDGGNVGIGTTSPIRNLQVQGAGNSYISVGSSSSNESQMGFNGTNMLLQTSGYSNGILFNNGSMYIASGNGTGNVGIGTASPATSAKLEIASTTGALLVPRMTTTQRDALTAVNGMIIYNSTTNTMQGYINSAWANM